jgi:SdpC family antimicrobial peptide
MKRVSGLTAAALLLAIATVMLGSTHASASVPQYTDQQVFEGIVFGHGPVAQAIPEIRAQNMPWSSETQQTASAVERAIVRRDPAFMKSFAQELESGDPGRVKKAMARMATLVTQVAYNPAGHRALDAGATTKGSLAGAVTDELSAVIDWVVVLVDEDMSVTLDENIVDLAFVKSGSFSGERLDGSIAAVLHK